VQQQAAKTEQQQAKQNYFAESANQQRDVQQQAFQQQQQQAAQQQAAQQQQALQQQQAFQQQAVEQNKHQKSANSEAQLERAIGEAVLGHSSMKSATANLAKLLEPKTNKAARASFGQRVRRNVFGVPVNTGNEQAKLPGVNVAQWVDPRVEREVASSVWRQAHPLDAQGALNSVEGRSQLASFAVPAPAAAPADCPLCAFNTDCSINLMARGFHRASGLSDNMPAYHGAITPYGGGGAHMSSLHATVGGVQQGAPLWDKLHLSDKARQEQLALNSVEGGEMLASFAPPPAAAPAPEPEVLCECPRCKLGEEQMGFDDELHEKQMLEDPDLLATVDDELMRLDPAYALRRVDGVAGNNVGTVLAAHGKANPFSDFTDSASGREAEFVNQVCPPPPCVYKCVDKEVHRFVHVCVCVSECAFLKVWCVHSHT